ncbi:MAG: electron transfer flavoprotein subunit beta/FixA family protein [Firmicutes bacterium]|nr:electron transfer flavoprotein subunit beta/FixA family protein [Bacillota bacterium]
MEIIVCIKQVPETRDVAVDEQTGVLLREGVDSILNPFDLYALEAGIRLKEQYGGRVTVISMGPPQAEAVIREAYMMGADRGFLLTDRAFAGADTLATALALAAGIEKIGGFDVIICGLQTTDGDTAQVGPGIAEILGLPHEANVISLGTVVDRKLNVVRDGGASIDTVAIELPCLITVSKSIGEPRLLSYRRKLAMADAAVTHWSAGDLGKDVRMFGLKGSPTQVERIFPPETLTSQEIWEGSAAELSTRLAEKLRELKFVGGDMA